MQLAAVKMRMATTMAAVAARAALCVWACAMLAGCFDSRSNASYGGETHFMQECEHARGCADDLACICGVCTRSCDDDAQCAVVGEHARCLAVDAESAACASGEATSASAAAVGAPARACAAECGGDGDCAELGAGFVCAAGVCREAASAAAPAVFERGGDGAEPGMTGEPGDGGCSGPACALAMQPLVLLVVDSSGSMERKHGCECMTAGCLECLPDCAAGERSRWIDLVEVLGGSLEGYGCEALERTEQNGATFDLGYFTPHHAPRGTPGDDGVLDLYRERVRFGLATFDGMDTYVGATSQVPMEVFDLDRSGAVEGLWSYNPIRALGLPLYTDEGGLVGEVYYPGCASGYYMDTGIRGPDAAQGGLVIASGSDSLAVNDRIQAELLVTRPFGGTPIAAAFDDLYYFLAFDPRAQAERVAATPRHVVLITDGEPDADYRHHGCDCAVSGDPADPLRCGGDPSNPRHDPALMTCPYPTAEEAARVLRCGHGDGCDGPADAVHVISYETDEWAQARLDEMAIEGGGADHARRATSPEELRMQLAAVLDEIAPQ